MVFDIPLEHGRLVCFAREIQVTDSGVCWYRTYLVESLLELLKNPLDLGNRDDSAVISGDQFDLGTLRFKRENQRILVQRSLDFFQTEFFFFQRTCACDLNNEKCPE